MKLESLFNVDRRIVFVFVFLSLLIPLLVPFAMTCKPARDVETMFDHVERAATSGKPIFLSWEFDPTGAAEQEPMARAVIRHIFARGGKAVVMCKSGGQQGEQLHLQILEECSQEYGAKYGEDWVYLPFKPGCTNIVINVGQNLRSTWPMDYRGTDLNNIPLTRNILRLADFEYSMVICSSLTIVVDWLTYGQSPYNLKMGFGVLGNVTPDCANYVNSGQITGLLGGLIGAAQYEQLLLDHGIGLTRRFSTSDLINSRVPQMCNRLSNGRKSTIENYIWDSLSADQQKQVTECATQKHGALNGEAKNAISLALNEAISREDIIPDAELGNVKLEAPTADLLKEGSLAARKAQVLRRLYVESVFTDELVKAGGGGQAMEWMTPQSIAHVVLIIAILFGNFCFLWDRARQKRRIKV